MKSKFRAVIHLWIFNFLLVSASNSTTHPFETKIIPNCSLGQTFSDVVNSSVQFILHYENIVGTGLRLHTESQNADENQPVVIVARQKKGVLSWQIPFLVRRDGQNSYDRYYSVNRTLCPIENNPKSIVLLQGSDVFVTVSTSSEENVSFTVLLYKQPEFRIDGFNQTVKGKKVFCNTT